MSALLPQIVDPQRFTYTNLRAGRSARWPARCWRRARYPQAVTLARPGVRAGVGVSVREGRVAVSDGVGRPVTIGGDGDEPCPAGTAVGPGGRRQ